MFLCFFNGLQLPVALPQICGPFPETKFSGAGCALASIEVLGSPAKSWTQNFKSLADFV